MIKTHLQEVIKKVEVADEILCNCCGKPTKKNIFNNTMDVEGNISDYYELDDSLHVEQTWGYFSNHDGEIHKFDVCQECYEKWISGFKIPVEVKEYF